MKRAKKSGTAKTKKKRQRVTNDDDAPGDEPTYAFYAFCAHAAEPCVAATHAHSAASPLPQVVELLPPLQATWEDAPVVEPVAAPFAAPPRAPTPQAPLLLLQPPPPLTAQPTAAVVVEHGGVGGTRSPLDYFVDMFVH
eukprot:TRINITY_DN18205_c0_g1_i1.p3 TRINITY_DN18205_c0_g1~~TRINITY_DN18205_c0_g1_i1.p3  ORF type:complete len:139 (+),score=51.80 TRINITY_DN18205_c0_g1_i1:43-459(+)